MEGEGKEKEGERQVREKRGFATAEVSSCLHFTDATSCKSSSDPGVEEG